MGLRANGTSGNYVQRTGNMPASWSDFTIGGQLTIQTDLNVQTAFMQIKDSSARFLAMYTNADGTSITLFDDYGSTGTNGVSIVNLTVGKTYGVAIRGATGRAAKMYVMDPATGTVTTNGGTMNAAYTGALNDLRLGNYNYGSACNAQFAGWWMYDVALTDDEVAQALRSLMPHRWSNLKGWWPMIGRAKADCLKDHSGQGDFAETGTAFTQEETHGVPWGSAGNSLIPPGSLPELVAEATITCAAATMSVTATVETFAVVEGLLLANATLSSTVTVDLAATVNITCAAAVASGTTTADLAATSSMTCAMRQLQPLRL
jgi:hypothetical protein